MLWRAVRNLGLKLEIFTSSVRRNFVFPSSGRRLCPIDLHAHEGRKLQDEGPGHSHSKQQREADNLA